MSCPNALSLRASRLAAILGLPAMLLAAGCREASDPASPMKALAASPQIGIAPPPSATEDIMALVSEVTAAWTAKNAAAYAAAYAEDVQVVSPVGSLLNGRTGFRNQHVFLFNGPFAGSTQTISVRDIIFLTGTIALVIQDVTLTGYAFLPPGLPSSGGVVRTRVVWVVEKRGPSWQIVFQQMTPQL